LRIEMLGRKRFFLAEFQHLLDRSNLFRHDDFLITAACSLKSRPDATLVRRLQNSRYFEGKVFRLRLEGDLLPSLSVPASSQAKRL